MQLPGISGAELACALRAACQPATALLAMSGSQPPAEVLAHFDGFLMKPFRMEAVAAAMKLHQAAAKTLAESAANSPNNGPTTPAHAAAKNSRRRRRSAVTLGPRAAATSIAQIASNQTMIATMQAEAGVGIGTGISAVPILNETIFQQLSRTMLASQMKEMYMLCLSDARQRIAGMRRLAAEHNGIQFVREAHAIKGGSGMLGATELHRRAAELEANGLAAGAQGSAQDVNSLDELNAACDRLESMLGARL